MKSVKSSVGKPLGQMNGMGELLGVGEGVGELLGVVEGVEEVLGVGDTLLEALGEALGLGEALLEALGLVDGVEDMLAEGVLEEVGVTDGEAVGDVETEADGLAAGDILAEGPGLLEGLLVGEAAVLGLGFDDAAVLAAALGAAPSEERHEAPLGTKMQLTKSPKARTSCGSSGSQASQLSRRHNSDPAQSQALPPEAHESTKHVPALVVPEEYRVQRPGFAATPQVQCVVLKTQESCACATLKETRIRLCKSKMHRMLPIIESDLRTAVTLTQC